MMNILVALGNAIMALVLPPIALYLYFFKGNFELAVIILLLSLASGQGLLAYKIDEVRR